MFTGIIEEIGAVTRVDGPGDERKMCIRAAMAQKLRVDESVSVNGACQTIVERDSESFAVVTIEETLRKTTLGKLEAGSAVNLERAMKLSDRLDGHIVQGHVDGRGEIIEIRNEKTDRLVAIRFDASFAPYLIPVGSITVDGISLTVAQLDDSSFTVALIPHTFELTTASEWAVGTEVNLEFDLLGKYVARNLALRS